MQNNPQLPLLKPCITTTHLTSLCLNTSTPNNPFLHNRAIHESKNSAINNTYFPRARTPLRRKINLPPLPPRQTIYKNRTSIPRVPLRVESIIAQSLAQKTKSRYNLGWPKHITTCFINTNLSQGVRRGHLRINRKKTFVLLYRIGMLTMFVSRDPVSGGQSNHWVGSPTFTELDCKVQPK